MQHENWNISLKLTLKIAMTEFKIEVVLVKFSAIIYFFHCFHFGIILWVFIFLVMCNLNQPYIWEHKYMQLLYILNHTHNKLKAN